MCLKEEFLKIKTYEEYQKRKNEFRSLDIKDDEIRTHWSSLFSKPNSSGFENGIIIEAYEKKRT